MAFDRLLEPITIHGMKVKNRMVMAPFSTGYANIDGSVTRRLLDHYAARAKGGVGLIIVEYSNVQPEGKGCIHTMLGAYHDKLIPGLSLLSQVIKENGARAALQLAHAGRQTATIFTGTPYIQAPSPIPLNVHGLGLPKEMTLEEIEATIENFGEAALRIKRAGFDALECHGAHGYLLFAFFSPLQNKRKDKYGGSLENRIRFGVEVIKRIREKVGPDFPVGYKLSIDEKLEGGTTPDDAAIFAKELVKAGIDWLQCSAGTYETVHHGQPPTYWSNDPNVNLAEAMKKVLDIPVMALGRQRNPEMMERVLAEGRADMIAMARPLFAEPELPIKIKERRYEDILQCTGCNECLTLWFNGLSMTCAFNPEAGRDGDIVLCPTNIPKRVLVIGGGPAGMEVARVAALRGHDVTIFEKSHRLGGQLNIASIPDFKEALRPVISWLENRARKAGVKIELGKEATVNNVRAFGPDIVIMANGAKPIKTAVPGIDKGLVIFAADALQNERKVGENVLVVGGGLIGCEVALFLNQKDRNVTIAEMMDNIAFDAEECHKLALDEWFPKTKINIQVNLTLKEVKDGEAVFLDKNKKEKRIEADTIVLAAGYEADRSLAEALEPMVEELYAIGDCAQARNIFHAVHDGNNIGRQI